MVIVKLKIIFIYATFKFMGNALAERFHKSKKYIL